MRNFTAYYFTVLDDLIHEYTVAHIHRVAEDGTLRGVDAMLEKGLTVACPEVCKEGWYYDEKKTRLLSHLKNLKKIKTLTCHHI
ncbi:hypothetical protein [Pseudomonas lini]